MKTKSAILAFMLFISIISVNAQTNFSMSCQDTMLNGSINSTMTFNCSITHFPTCCGVVIAQIIQSTNLPSGWTATVCDPSNVCVAASDTFIVGAASTVITKFEIHAGNNPATGTIQARIEDAGNPSDFVQFTLTGTTTTTAGIADNNQSIVYLEQNFPNPFSNLTTIKYHLEQPNGKLLITDVLGKTIAEYKLNTTSGELILNEKLNAGIYFYSLYSNDKIISKNKMLVQ